MNTAEILPVVINAGACLGAVSWLQANSDRPLMDVVKELTPAWSAWALRHLPQNLTQPWRDALIAAACRKPWAASTMLRDPCAAKPLSRQEREQLLNAARKDPHAAGWLLYDPCASGPWSRKERAGLLTAAKRSPSVACNLLRNPGVAYPWSHRERLRLVAAACQNRVVAYNLIRDPSAAGEWSQEELAMFEETISTKHKAKGALP